ncbi:DUF1674 domain-containing protein [Dyella sp. A6]|uniref:DUF1674 domain-containing protein n=1 Tax=Dyella aluminiiresistens TaxID=3069105 RepID=UPI002E7A0F0A|nr:DUF1674 domain-containing protein [Dyella sp. A6]
MSKTPTQTDTMPQPAKPERRDVPAVDGSGKGEVERPALDPTRYGDWEKNGRCIDF